MAQQKAPEQAAQAKAGPSKFDQTLQSKSTSSANAANTVKQAGQVAPTSTLTAAQKTQVAQAVERAGKTERTQLGKSTRVTGKAPEPVEKKPEAAKPSLVAGMVNDMERGGKIVEQLVSGALKGRSFSNSELLSLQAGMYKYTQELELTGKVVEKATTGLKDTLKTQV